MTNYEARFEVKGPFLCLDGRGKLITNQTSNKKLCFTSTDRDFLMKTLAELASQSDCQFVKLSSNPKDGMYLGRCFFTTDEIAAIHWAKLKDHPKLMCNIQDDDFVKPHRTSSANRETDPLVTTSVEATAQPTLTTKRLILTPYEDTDVEDIYEYANSPEVAKFVPWEAHMSLDDSRAFLQYIRESTSVIRGKLFFVFAIRLKETGRVIGSFDFKNINPKCGQLDYALGPAYWNQGFVTEAATAVKDWALKTLPDMVRLQAFCVEENVASSRVMEKIGMEREGVRRKAFVLKGTPVNLVDYSIVR